MAKHTFLATPRFRRLPIDPAAIATIEGHNQIYGRRPVTILSEEEQDDGSLLVTYDVGDDDV